MISAIICSREGVLRDRVSASIAASVGVPHEVVVVDNRDGRYGICEAYNRGAGQARYETLCFVHEDVVFHTTGWGEIVTAILQDPSVGLLGVGGSTYRSAGPAGWWFCAAERMRFRLIQYRRSRGRAVLEEVNPLGERLADVASLDGLWLCMRRHVWEEHSFDAASFPGFHGYDADISMQVLQKYRVCVTFDVLVEHLSEGKIDRPWLSAARSFSTKWRRQLPVSVLPLSRRELAGAEAYAYWSLANQLYETEFPRRLAIWYSLRAILADPRRAGIYGQLAHFILGERGMRALRRHVERRTG